MNTNRRSYFCPTSLKALAASVLMALPLFFAAAQTENAKPGSSSADANLLPDEPGKDVVLKKCQSCHSIRTVISRHGTADDWAQEVSKMISRGASISDDEAETIVDYLAAHFGPSESKPDEPSHSGDASPKALALP